MKIYAFIPARGGSKGIPLKNIRLFNGKPLIATAIDAANNSRYVKKVYVSTDSSLVATKSKELGANVIMRPQCLGTDTASSESVLLDALEQLSNVGDVPDLVVFLQCTAPFMTSTDIDGTVQALLDDNADSSLAVVPFNHFLWKKGNIDNIGAQGINHDGRYRKRRQDLEPQYLEAGSVYVMKTNLFKEEKTRFCGKTTLYEIDDPSRELEIDDASEFYMAEKKLQWFNMDQTLKEKYRNKAIAFDSIILNIKAVVFDFDGVFTDDCVYQDENGREMVRCSRTDGMGISILKNETSLRILVLSTEINSCVFHRCKKLGIEVINSCKDKLSTLVQWAKIHDISLSEILYCGNDINDLKMLKEVGLFICPANSVDAVKDSADMVLPQKGGEGFVRKVCDLLLSNSEKFKKKCFYVIGEKDYRPWGFWEVINVSENHCIKRIIVLPNQKLSYQYHNHRSERWIIIKGKGLVTIDDTTNIIEQDEQIFINIGSKHQIENISNNSILELIEIQTGDLLKEDDIVRLSDKYGRK
ncbi:HAD hydrolase family protein [Succinatimonas hippei]|uniref:cytidylyltransferase domain-containing protein n=1 Tax=Succinatimonas hippei TaxID=626938 RepID=UPI0025A420CA|nr:HAD hydrolase family protein [Succinatimonas hippei]MDM8119941.1 HAD hydrolase family protein [Succinatimonas hippei]